MPCKLSLLPCMRIGKGRHTMGQKITSLSVRGMRSNHPTEADLAPPAAKLAGRQARERLLSCSMQTQVLILSFWPSRAQADSGAEDDMDVSEGDDLDPHHKGRPGRFSGRTHRDLAALGQDQQAGEDDADDFKAGSASEEDDEATLEEEEVFRLLLLHSRCSILILLHDRSQAHL